METSGAGSSWALLTALDQDFWDQGTGMGRLGKWGEFERDWQGGEKYAEGGLEAKGQCPARHLRSGHRPAWMI